MTIEEEIDERTSNALHHDCLRGDNLVDLRAQLAEKERQLAEAQQESRGRGEGLALAVRDWLYNPERTPAADAFESGSVRQLAYGFEKALQAHLTATRAEVEALRGQLATLTTDLGDLSLDRQTLRSALAVAVGLLKELHVQVRGECPSLLNEDSGGDVQLAMSIEKCLASPLAAGARVAKL